MPFTLSTITKKDLIIITVTFIATILIISAAYLIFYKYNITMPIESIKDASVATTSTVENDPITSLRPRINSNGDSVAIVITERGLISTIAIGLTAFLLYYGLSTYLGVPQAI